MPSTARAPRSLLLTGTVLVGLIDVLLYAFAVGVLSDGPSALGYSLLLVANRTATLVAFGAALAVVVGGLEDQTDRGSAMVRSMSLLLAAGVAAAVAIGLFSLGRALAGFAAEAQSLELNSLLLAVSGTGYDLMAVPVVLALGAAVLPLGRALQGAFAERAAFPAADAPHLADVGDDGTAMLAPEPTR